MRVVLHICCAVCAAGAAETLMAEGHTLLGFYYNPNTHPQEEYMRRLSAVRRVSQELGFPLEEGVYDADSWFRETDSLKDEPEGGIRCEKCFRIRLEETYRFMLERGYDAFATTLTIGPRKPASVVNRIGRDIGGDAFLCRDFKKKDGFKRATALARQWELYRQNYCGCIYSLKERTG